MNRYLIFLLLILSSAVQAVTPFAESSVVPEATRQAAPAFEIENLRGGKTGLSGYRGNVVLLNFWATWCMPCREEMPGMEMVWQKYKEQGFVVLAISNDEGSKARVETFSKIMDLSFPIVLDPDGEVNDLYEVSSMPTSFLIDRNGKVISRIVGSVEWSTAEAMQFIEELLVQ